MVSCCCIPLGVKGTECRASRILMMGTFGHLQFKSTCREFSTDVCDVSIRSVFDLQALVKVTSRYTENDILAC